MKVRIVLPAILAILAIAAAAQEPVFRTNTRIVDVSLVATDSKGAPVTDLRADELRVFDNKRPQSIVSFEAPGAMHVPAGKLSRRYEVIVLDTLNTGWSDQIYVRKAAASMLDTMQSGDRIAIFTIGDNLKLLHDFSGDTASLRAAIDAFQGERPEMGVALEPSGPNTPRRFRMPPAEAGLRQRERILETFDFVSAIARIMVKAPGRKNLLWVSAGFPLNSRGESFHDDAKKMARNLSAADVAMYPVDARGLSTSRRAIANIRTMEEIAEATGGKAFYNSNDIAGSMRAAVNDARERYALAYAPADARDDGTFHTIRLETTRPGVHLRYRSGYVAAPDPAALIR